MPLKNTQNHLAKKKSPQKQTPHRPEIIEPRKANLPRRYPPFSKATKHRGTP